MSYPELLARVRSTAVSSPEVLLHFVDDHGVAESVPILDFVAGADALGLRLQGAGARPGDRVAIRGAGGGRAVAEAILATVLGGCVAVPLVSLLGDADVDLILGLSQARVFLSEAAIKSRDMRPLLDRVAARGTPQIAGGLGALASDPRFALEQGTEVGSADWSSVADGDTALVLFSSGTTGVPKGAMHSYSTVMAEVLDFADQLDLTHGGVGLQPFPLGHVGGVAGLFIALCLGREMVFLSSWDARVAFDAIKRFRVTATGSAPFFAQTLFDECDRRHERLPTLHTMESGGGPVGRELVYRADALGIALSRGYGSTEHPTACTHHSGDPLQVRAETDGRPTAATELRIVNGSGSPCAIGVDGEVQLRGPEQFTGYLSGDLSAFGENGWFRTGDVGRLDARGYLTITGRLKEIIIRGGENIAMAEVETVLALHPSVAAAAVVGVPDARFGERVHAYFVRAAGTDPVNLDDIRHHFEALGVARFKVPEFLTEVSDLPRNGLGKVQRHLLGQRAPDRSAKTVD